MDNFESYQPNRGYVLLREREPEKEVQHGILVTHINKVHYADVVAVGPADATGEIVIKPGDIVLIPGGVQRLEDERYGVVHHLDIRLIVPQ